MAAIEPCHQAFGLRVRMIREAVGMTQAELAKRVFLKRTSVVNTEAGRQRVSLDAVELYAKALNSTPKHLLKGLWW